MEGANSVSLENCTVSGNMQGTYNDDSENIQGVMIYQSMSGDAEVGTASFSSKDGSIAALEGDLFYVTNTNCESSLENTQLSSATGVILKAVGNDSARGWGESGKNGGAVVLTATNQTIEGDIIVDEISSLDMTLSEGSSLKGAVNTENSGGEINVTLDSSSAWTLTGDSYITSFNGDTSSIKTNGYSLYVNGEKPL